MTERKYRNKRMRELGEKIQHKVLKEQIMKSAFVLPEKIAKKQGYYMCRAENYLSVLVPEVSVKQGVWMRVRYEKLEEGYLIAKPCDKTLI